METNQLGLEQTVNLVKERNQSELKQTVKLVKSSHRSGLVLTQKSDIVQLESFGLVDQKTVNVLTFNLSVGSNDSKTVRSLLDPVKVDKPRP